MLPWTLENHRKRWGEAWYIPPEMSSENFEDMLARQDIKSTTIWKYSNDLTTKNNSREVLEMVRPCSPKGQKFKHQNCADLGSWGKEKERTTKEHPEAHRGERGKTWGGIVGGRRRLLPATVVSGVFCCTASCVLQVMDKISNLIKVKRLSKTVCT
mgnify:CR=1 FL=1